MIFKGSERFYKANLQIRFMKKNSIEKLLEFSIINLDKPAGPTSFIVSQFVKEKLKLGKTSHLGTLDPGVSGVLPIALGRACKLNESLMHKNKTYVGIMRLHSDISDNNLNKEIKFFIGKIKQLPPVRSSVKRAVREREIISFKVLEREEKDVLFETEVEAGTYIRKLIHDIGENIGGAHMLELRRIKAGIFSESDDNFVNLYDFEKALKEYERGKEERLGKMLIPAEEVIRKNLFCLQIKEGVLKQILTGKPLFRKDFADDKIDKIEEGERFAVFCDDKFIGIYKKVDEDEIISRPEFVFN